MSAMHWEARRRQGVLDRRRATKAQTCLTEGQQEPTPENKEPPDVKLVCHGQSGQEQYSTKIQNRYTSTQYFQQW